jgi:hypothetical protein
MNWKVQNHLEHLPTAQRGMINPSFVKLNELIPDDDWEYFEDRDMSMREAAGGIKFMKDVTETLGLRENRYGEFRNVSATSQWLKDIMRGGASWKGMEPFMQESLDLIANKLARIVNGDPFYDDSWHDIGGYAKLVEIEIAKGK